MRLCAAFRPVIPIPPKSDFPVLSAFPHALLLLLFPTIKKYVSFPTAKPTIRSLFPSSSFPLHSGILYDMMTGNDIREAFLHFFAQRGHQVLPSSSLVPDDPTTLFTTAGMQQFVPWFRREVIPPYGSVVTVQKCARTDDLDEVGHTARHQTFFEMLGNFSFGDYFKRETLQWGWEFSTRAQTDGGLGLDPAHIWVTYYKPNVGEPYQEDVEARQIWLDIGVPDTRIIPLGKKENWWGPVGDSGPCGPCSEMHYDRGAHLACRPDCTSPACGCDRWIEFWNHVFQQFNFTGGQYVPLPVPGIDTGAGLERIVSLVQGVESNYDTDLFSPLMQAIVRLAGDSVVVDRLALRVIADHLRCASFMIADGVRPGNVKRNYVVRRIIRRAYRFGRILGFRQPFLHALVPTLDMIMGEHYHALRDNLQDIIDTLRAEEEGFAKTLERGEDLLAQLIADANTRGEKVLNGADVFTLYDTYGFPRELTEETALEAGLTIDAAGYALALAEARKIAGAGGKFAYEASTTLGADIPPTSFLGYEVTETEARLLHFEAVGDAREFAVVVLDSTPFYATSGGQCTDAGVLQLDGMTLSVLEVARDRYGHFLHTVDIRGHEDYVPSAQHTVTARVDGARRNAIRRAHTATHLLHWALQQVLGEHAKQAGSLVDADMLRFDFSHAKALSADELRRVEMLVFARVLEDTPVIIREMSLHEARQAGYTALFGEKYGEWVRTVNIGDAAVFSRELCGGTHLDRTGQLGYFKIMAESSVAAGIRRIEAVTGLRAIGWADEQAAIIHELSTTLKAPADELLGRVVGLQREVRDAQQQLNELKVKLAAGGGGTGPTVEEIGTLHAVIAALDGVDAGTLASLADQYLNKIQPGVVALASALDGKVLLAVKVSKELSATLHAGHIIREMAKQVGGGGGGRPDFAQAGGKDPSNIPAALQSARMMIVAGQEK